MTSAPPSCDVPEPPEARDHHLETVKAGTVVHRIHDKRFAAAGFNPGYGDSRFAPIASADGKKIPTMYAATSFACAAFEYVFHDIDPNAAFKSVPWAKIDTLAYSTLQLKRDLNLACLFAPDLLRWNCSRMQLIDTPPSSYPKTRKWSAAIHDSDDVVDGMLWTSRKHDAEKAMIFFGDRVNAAHIDAKTSVDIASDAAALDDLHSLAKRAGIFIAR